MSRSPGPLYRLACTLSLAHIASALATIIVYDVEDARDSQFIAILYALNTFYMVYMLIPHTVQKDNDAVSRLNKQFVIINFLLLCWVLSVGMVPLTVSAGITRTLHSCAAITFMSPKCLTIGVDMALPFALIATLGTISWNIYQDARAIQAVQAVPRQQQPHAPFKLRPARVRRGASSASVA
ncbi:hypothetical protein B0H13DRAFT_2155318 [Mycena leptocephala]|nr:hypothetical protein B0H13DRAFT_2167492 [Mycena leptocephala]KAJ7806627.1 hypothetical protein B0H13DRAFT_2155318 [Mycena leptocephala]